MSAAKNLEVWAEYKLGKDDDAGNNIHLHLWKKIDGEWKKSGRLIVSDKHIERLLPKQQIGKGKQKSLQELIRWLDASDSQ